MPTEGREELKKIVGQEMGIDFYKFELLSIKQMH